VVPSQVFFLTPGAFSPLFSSRCFLKSGRIAVLPFYRLTFDRVA